MRTAHPRLAPLWIGAALVAATGVPAAAQVDDGGETDGDEVERADAEHPLPLEALGGLSPELVGLGLEGQRWEVAEEAWQRARDELAAAEEARLDADGLVAELTPVVEDLTEQQGRAARARAEADRREEAAQRRLVTVAVAEFIGPTEVGAPTVPVALGDVEARVRRQVLGRAVDDANREELAAASTALASAVAEDERVSAALADVEGRLVDAGRSAAEALTATQEWTEERDRQLATLTRLAPGASVAGTDLSVVALDAYLRASARSERRGCPVPWTVLAGIGRVESGHGTYRGARPDDRGDVRPAIIGIALDGTRDTAVITDTDAGVLDGDPLVDRAVGPLQFIPDTWRRSGVDANRDGVADPQNLYDAAASAAGYLCRAAGGAPVADVLDTAVFSYNHDPAYVSRVVGLATRYAEVPIPA